MTPQVFEGPRLRAAPRRFSTVGSLRQNSLHTGLRWLETPSRGLRLVVRLGQHHVNIALAVVVAGAAD